MAPYDVPMFLFLSATDHAPAPSGGWQVGNMVHSAYNYPRHFGDNVFSGIYDTDTVPRWLTNLFDEWTRACVPR